jgi:diaminopimelate decarboxylase
VNDDSVWTARVECAVREFGTPCYATAWKPIEERLKLLDCIKSPVPLRSWLSFKTHPLPALAAAWRGAGRGVEVVSEREFCSLVHVGATLDDVLVNGVAKHTWLVDRGLHRLRVHFDSLTEIRALLPIALEQQWRVGVRIHAPDECDARDSRFSGQFGLSRAEAVAALTELRTAGADVQSVHFHLGQHAYVPGAYQRAVAHAAAVCAEAGVWPAFLDCGGALPSPSDASCDAAMGDLEHACVQAATAFERLQEIWIENGRFVTETSTVLAVTVVDIKERDECRYVICDGGRTNHALAADNGTHRILLVPPRSGRLRLTTVCGPTCMSDDILGRWMLPDSVAIGDVVVWLDAGAYHLPWETRFSHGLCPIAWFDEREQLTIARARETNRAAAVAKAVAS